jgi:hypothetical protein
MGLSIEYISRLSGNPKRSAHWDDAVRGLPVLNRAEAAAIRKNRLIEFKNKEPKLVLPEHVPQDSYGYSYQGYLTVNSIVTVVKDFKDIAEIDDEGYISEIRDDGRGEQYLVVFPNGEDWFSEIDVEKYLVETGRDRIDWKNL